MDLITLMKNSIKVVVLTGAGMSTESGLKDFRSNGGLWAGKDPMRIASTSTIRPKQEDESTDDYLARLEEFKEFYRWRVQEIDKYQPNEGHRILSKWQKDGKIHRVITQNVDGYHQKAGSEEVIELHGNLLGFHCEWCKAAYKKSIFDTPLGVLCAVCSVGIVRPNLTLFGEPLSDDINVAIREAKNADLMLVLGTSLQVSPANLLPVETIMRDGLVAIINRDSTPLDKYASVVVNDRDITEVLKYIDSKLY
jgi:NAD-dependent deacetylase